jgi:hypothetical protein
MNNSEARKILEHYSAAEELNLPIAEAIARIDVDPVLAAWFAQTRELDQTMAGAVAAIPVPPGLKEAVLSERKIIRAEHWWNRPVFVTAAAATIALLAVAGVYWVNRPGKSFAEYRQSVVEESWGRAPHLDIETSDLGQLNKWLASKEPGTTVTLPSGLKDLNLHGARTLDWRGHTVVLLCLSQANKHLHLFVMNDQAFADVPRQSSPDFEKCNGWKTVSWTQGSRSYVLTGMNYFTFLKKFRHDRQWTMDGES